MNIFIAMVRGNFRPLLVIKYHSQGIKIKFLYILYYLCNMTVIHKQAVQAQLTIHNTSTIESSECIMEHYILNSSYSHGINTCLLNYER